MLIQKISAVLSFLWSFVIFLTLCISSKSQISYGCAPAIITLNILYFALFVSTGTLFYRMSQGARFSVDAEQSLKIPRYLSYILIFFTLALMIMVLGSYRSSITPLMVTAIVSFVLSALLTIAGCISVCCKQDDALAPVTYDPSLLPSSYSYV
jgi:hypothetical protein